SGKLASGSTYRWRARAYDGTDYSKAYIPSSTTWYYFTVDTVVPVAPTVTSSNCPAGVWSASGTKCTFTFSPGTSTNVTSYNYGLDQPTPTTSTTSTTVTLATAPADGAHTMYVRSKSRAGLLGPITAYAFNIGAASVTSPSE